MRFINELHEGDRLNGIYLCKQKQAATTKNGKPYENVILQDKTGMLDGKIWDPNSLGIDDFDALVLYCQYIFKFVSQLKYIII